jgi:ectoine hydroxylase-related dioxygenase (phytanoyl-CoA dioxygenase family)
MIPPPVARRAGDVIVYHHRMFHAATQNFSGRIRMAPPEGSPVPTS